MAGANAPVVDGPVVRWRLAASLNKSLDISWNGLQSVSRHVAAATGGRFQIQVFASGELVPPFGVLDAVGNGTVPIGFAPSFYFIGKDPTFAFDCAMPFGLNSRQHSAWMLQGGGLEMLRALYRDYRVLNLPCTNTGAQMGGWFRKEIRSIDDLKGLKYRIGGLAGQVLSRLGVTPQAIPITDVYPALERGTIDAAKFAGPNDDERAGMFNVARYYYAPGWSEGNTHLSIFVNLDEWNRLPESYRAILEAACYWNMVSTQAAFDTANPPALSRMIAKGTRLKRFPDDMLKAAYRISHEMYDEFADTHPRFRKVYDAWRRFLGREIAWFGVAERPYDNFMGNALRAH